MMLENWGIGELVVVLKKTHPDLSAQWVMAQEEKKLYSCLLLTSSLPLSLSGLSFSLGSQRGSQGPL